MYSKSLINPKAPIHQMIPRISQQELSLLRPSSSLSVLLVLISLKPQSSGCQVDVQRIICVPFRSSQNLFECQVNNLSDIYLSARWNDCRAKSLNLHFSNGIMSQLNIMNYRVCKSRAFYMKNIMSILKNTIFMAILLYLPTIF